MVLQRSGDCKGSEAGRTFWFVRAITVRRKVESIAMTDTVSEVSYKLKDRGFSKRSCSVSTASQSEIVAMTLARSKSRRYRGRRSAIPIRLRTCSTRSLPSFLWNATSSRRFCPSLLAMDAKDSRSCGWSSPRWVASNAAAVMCHCCAMKSLACVAAGWYAIGQCTQQHSVPGDQATAPRHQPSVGLQLSAEDAQHPWSPRSRPVARWSAVDVLGTGYSPGVYYARRRRAPSARARQDGILTERITGIRP